MALSTSDLDNIVGQAYKTAPVRKSVTAETDSTKSYDIFLSHSRLDEKIILQINYLLEDRLGFDVYVDCIEGAASSHEAVTPATAAHLRDVMTRCSSLIYAVSVNAASSKWMPWELGYSDATHGKVAVLPITGVYATAQAYQSQEFVGLYPYIDILPEVGGDGSRFLWVMDPQDTKRYSKIHYWQSSGALFQH